MARADQMAHLSGLEMMRGVLEGRLPYATISQTLDYLLIDVAEGRAVFQGSPGTAHCVQVQNAILLPLPA